ncbi:Ethylene receptor 2 [Actinoplanes sp. SE50]|uniref:sensor histidine kinase n=1 Tax=unclassified Actinoplanes TaxID=2626549 RepID=UPI00023EC4FA|nr:MULTISPECIES: ATP-binding protein [unclassified Actinoplanes]AEV87023.1 Ethylene receptor 2 [Actinoplanes sp. SE50/110]ATO85421.1 Ethylene receptor 2 [Actinoplanes sp. SE50]SLM02833.1 two-component system sensor histidine kinase [Actinoplanes sp. SE50/110]
MRRSYALVALAVTTLVALAFVIPLALLVHSAVQDRAMREAERQALGLSAVVVVATDRDLVLNSIMSTRAGQNGELAAHLPTLGTVGVSRVTPDAVIQVRQRETAGTVDVDGGRVYLRPVALPQGLIAVIEVFVPGTALRAGVGTAVLVLVLEAVVLVGLCMALADRLAARIVRSTRDLARTATSLGAGQLHARVRPSGPREIEEVGAALNLLADRFLELLAKERALAANLSHRLRVPLTALRLNTEALTAGEDRDRQLRVVDRLEYEISAVISEASRPLAARPRLQCDLGAVVADRTGFWGALAEDQGRPWQADPPPDGLTVPAAWSRVTEALDVLLGNVFHHTGEDAACRVTVVRSDGSATVIVDDAGPGFTDPDAALARGASDANSTGLGLDIAQRLAADTGGTLTVSGNEWGGARVSLTLGTLPDETPAAAPRRRRWWHGLGGAHARR